MRGSLALLFKSAAQDLILLIPHTRTKVSVYGILTWQNPAVLRNLPQLASGEGGEGL